MGINQSSTIGRIRLTPPIASTLDRLVIDGKKAKELSLKMEEDVYDETEIKAEGVTDNGIKAEESNGASEEKETVERGSDIVQDTITRTLDERGWTNDEILDEATKIQRVCSCRALLGWTIADKYYRPSSSWITG